MLGYDPLLANQVYTAGDFFLIPSQYEPCGLTDYIAQLAGNLPIVHLVGGLVKVEDGISGFAFKEYTPEALVEAIQRALEIFDSLPEEILKMQKTAVTLIKENYTWDQVVLRYLSLYEKAAHILD
jgi:starch synthase